MNVQLIAEDWDVAHEKYREYRAALKVERNKQIAYLATIYWQLSRGRKVIDVISAISNAGVNEKGEPKLALAEAHQQRISFYRNWQECFYYHDRNRRYPVVKFARPKSWPDRHIWGIDAPVPLIPPSCVPPDAKLENLHILWEVEKWEPIPSADPLLLRKLDGPFFVVLAAWNLTSVEQAVMAAGLRM